MVPQSIKRAKICMRCWIGLVFSYDEVEKRGNESLDELEFTFVLHSCKREWMYERKGALENVPEAMASIACLGNSMVMRLDQVGGSQ
jgi:hypothetical protein